MPTILINDEAERALRSCAGSTFKPTATRRPDGMWEVPVGEDVAEALAEKRMPGESLSDVIIRTVATQAGKH